MNILEGKSDVAKFGIEVVYGFILAIRIRLQLTALRLKAGGTLFLFALITLGIFCPPSSFGQRTRYYVEVHNGTDDPEYNQVFCNGYAQGVTQMSKTIDVEAGDVSPVTFLGQFYYYNYVGTLHHLCANMGGGIPPSSPFHFTYPTNTHIDIILPVYVNGAEPEYTKEPSPSSTDSDTLDPIDTKNGNNYFTENRLFVPCPGIPLELDLKYQSVAELPDGTLGDGWRHSLQWDLDIQNSQAVLYTGDGKKQVFGADGGEGYLSPESNSWTLDETASGYAVGMPGGLAYTFDTNGVLSTINDAWGNGVECTYGTNSCLESATHSNGQRILFSNEVQNAISEWRIVHAEVVDGMALAFSYNSDGQVTQIVETVGSQSYASSYQYDEGILVSRINGGGNKFSFSSESEEFKGKIIYYNADVYLYDAAFDVPATPETSGTYEFPKGKGTHLDVDGYYEHDVIYGDPFTTDVSYSLRGMKQIYRYCRDEDQMLETKYGPGASLLEAMTRGVTYAYATNSEDRTETTLFDDGLDATWSEWMLYDDTHNVTNYAVAYCTTTPVHQLSIEYDSIWQLPSMIIDAENRHVEILYTNGSPLVVKSFYTNSNSYDTSFSYSTNGLVKAITNANGHVAGFDYDDVGNLIRIAAEVGPVVTNTYDALGFLRTTEFYVEESEFVSRRITEWGRDAKGQVEWIYYPDGLTNFYTYNALGYLTHSIDRAGRETDFTYAPGRNLKSITQYLEQGGSNVNVRISYDLDEQMNHLKIAEPSGRYVESYALDIQNRVTSVTNIESQVMSIDYGIGNFVQGITRFDDSTITNRYDGAGRLSSATYNAQSASPLTLTYDYYSDSRVKVMDDSTSSISYTYDKLNRLVTATNLIELLSSAVTFQYDPVGNVTNSNVSIDGTPALSSAYIYDAAERLYSVARQVFGSTTNASSTFDYNPRNGAVSSVQHNTPGISCSYSYDIMERIDTITYRKDAGSLIRSINYDYDAVGMITNKTIAGGVGHMTMAYEYDSIDRLTSETRTSASSPSKITRYVYDLAGNRQIKTDNDYSVSYTLGAGNRLASLSASYTNDLVTDVRGTSSEDIGVDDRWGELWVSNLTSQVGTKPQTDGADFLANNLAMRAGTNEFVAAIRDGAGNMGYATNTVVYSVVTNTAFLYDTAGCVTHIAHTGTGGFSDSLDLDWDERYRLASAAHAVSEIEYGYDVLNRKISRTEGSATEYYIYEGSQIVADVDSSGTLLRSYVWGMDIDSLLSFTDHTSSNTYYVIKDLQNTVIALVDEKGEVVEAYEYDAYGRTKVFNEDGSERSASAYGNRYCFQGREIDWVTGLYYFRARWYDPETGRWLSKDPIGIAGGYNLYEFCGSNPVKYTDPFGQSFRWHGEWGGSGWAAGQWKPESQLTLSDLEVASTDPRDQAYKNHDIDICERQKHTPGHDRRLGRNLLKVPPWRKSFWMTDRGVPLPAPVESVFWFTGLPGIFL